jgi:hypothetical protein
MPPRRRHEPGAARTGEHRLCRIAGAATRHEQGRPLRTIKLHIRTPEPVMIADLDTLLTAPYVELTDRIIPFRGPARGRRAPRGRRDAAVANGCCAVVS